MAGTYSALIEVVEPSILWQKLQEKGNRCVPYMLTILIDNATHSSMSSAYHPYKVIIG